MPGMNWLEVAEWVQARRPDLPVVVGYADAKVTGMEKFRVLKKPIHREHLAAALIGPMQPPLSNADNIVPLRNAGRA